ADGGGTSWAAVPLAAPQEPPDLRRAARDWYEREYRPVVAALAAERLLAAFPGRASGDVYGYVGDHRWYLSERRGWDVGIDAALADFVQRHAPDRSTEAAHAPAAAPGAGRLARAGGTHRGWLRGAVARGGAALAALRAAILPAAPEPAVRTGRARAAPAGRGGELREWAGGDRGGLAGHALSATGTTGRLLEERRDLPVTELKSGPLGGDQQIGAMIAESGLDC